MPLVETRRGAAPRAGASRAAAIAAFLLAAMRVADLMGLAAAAGPSLWPLERYARCGVAMTTAATSALGVTTTAEGGTEAVDDLDIMQAEQVGSISFASREDVLWMSAGAVARKLRYSTGQTLGSIRFGESML